MKEQRPIEFRGKKKFGTKEWIYGDLSTAFAPEMFVFPSDGMNSPDYYEVIPETVSQFIGLTDKNGGKIWGRCVYNGHG